MKPQIRESNRYNNETYEEAEARRKAKRLAKENARMVKLKKT